VLFLTLPPVAARRRLSREALAKLQRYDFPGNVRELRNLIERALILSVTDTIREESFPLPSKASESSEETGHRSSQAQSSSWVDLLWRLMTCGLFLQGSRRRSSSVL
jgi:DNA-binding NtrC family response regulator